MKIIRVPIFTEEYKIIVAVGKVEELAKLVSNTCEGWDYEEALEQSKKARGSAYNRLPDKHPLIAIDIDLPYEMFFATLPHEASHCADYIIDFLSINDNSGEFRGHIISAVVRQTIESLLKGKKLIAK